MNFKINLIGDEVHLNHPLGLMTSTASFCCGVFFVLYMIYIEDDAF